MYSRRSIVLAVLVGLAFMASTTQPWIQGSRLLAGKLADKFSFSGVGYDGSFRAVDDSFHREFDTDGIHGVQVEVPLGDITVTRARDDKISIDGERVAYGPSDQIARDRLRYVCLDAVQDGDIVRIIGSVMQPEPSSANAPGPNGGSTSIVLGVPSGIAVDVRSKAGTVALNGLQGKVETYVDMGNVEARSIAGDLTIKTSAGRIAVTNATIEEELSLTTSMGNIEFDGSLGTQNYIEASAGRVQMTVPRSTCVTLNAVTNAGKVDIRLPVTQTELEGTKSSAVGILGQGQPTGDLKIRVLMGEINISGK